ncbi:hypothetical protein ACFL50_00075 [Candidatus Latescibacterota bacterium]
MIQNVINIFWIFLFIPSIVFSQETTTNRIVYNYKTYPLYPSALHGLPDMPSPCTTDDGVELVIVHTTDDSFFLFPVTVENGDSLNVKQSQYGKGRQCVVDSADFPALAKTGLHNETELNRTKTITGKSIADITAIGRPMEYSRSGFMAEDEDIISVLKGDNRLVKSLGLTHPQMVRPLFHLWNIVLGGVTQGVWINEQMKFDYMLYNTRKIYLTWEGRGWQESIFNDEILGQYHLVMWRELDQTEKQFLSEHYSHLSEEELANLTKKLSYIHTGEMALYYIMRYGFYEGHSDFRAEPIAISFIFGLKRIGEIHDAFDGDIHKALTEHFTQ